jgi:hypothetical protein
LKLRRFKVNELGVGLLCLLPILIFAYGFPENAYYPKHDFLDHIVTLSSVWAEESTFFKPTETLPRLLNGSIPAGSLGISDLSVPHYLYAIFPTAIAMGISEIVGRTVSYFAMFFLTLSLLGKSDSAKWAAVVAGISFALMPYWPVITWTLAALALSMLGIIRLYQNERHRWFWMMVLVAAPHLAYFAWGGFLQPLFVFATLLVAVLRSRVNKFLVAGVTIGVVSSIVSALGLIRVLTSAQFTSHREDWPTGAVVNFSEAGNALQIFPAVFFGGTYHFGTIFSAGASSRLLILFVLAASLLFSLVAMLRSRHRGKPGYQSIPRMYRSAFTVFLVLGVFQVVVSVIFVAENSGLTALALLFQVPFQISRIIAFSPIIWALILGTTAYLVFISVQPKQLKLLAFLGSLLVIVQAVLVHPSISSSVRSALGLSTSSGLSTYEQYFQPETYNKLLTALNARDISASSLSFGLDPMVAAQNGFIALDGYVYNYPLSYKREFAKIIEEDLAQPGGQLEYFRDWGSRLYLFDRGVPASELRFDWCQAQQMGARAVLSARDLSELDSLALLEIVDQVHLYEIVELCMPNSRRNSSNF